MNTGEARATATARTALSAPCKHVVKRDAMQTNGPTHASAGMPNFTDPEYEAICAVDHPGRDPGRHVCAVRRVRRREF